MIYLLYGIQKFLINKKIKEIININKIDKYNIDYFDLEKNSLKEIIESANTISLFSDKKVIIVENCYLFTGISKKTEEKEINILNQYINNINSNTILIFCVESEKLDSRKKIVTNIKKAATIIEFNELINLEQDIKELFSPYIIDYNTIKYLIDRVGNDMNVINNEIKKIKTYKNEDLIIKKEDILDLTYKNINTDIFYLLDNILNNNKESAIESYNEMLKLGEEPIKILVMLANQFRLIYQVKELYKKGNRDYEIMDILEQKQYTIKKASERINKYSSEQLLDYILELSNLDINIKSGLIDKNIALELFILNIETKTSFN